MMDDTPSLEVGCHCCLGQGHVMSPEGQKTCPLCEGYLTVPQEVHDRFLEVVAARRLAKGQMA